MPLPLHLHAMPFPLRYTSLTIIRGKRHRLPPWSQLFIEGEYPLWGLSDCVSIPWPEDRAGNALWGLCMPQNAYSFGHIPAAVVNLSPKRQEDMLF